ncbi:pol [Lasius niger]|uniref:Pol n=1 Tax=Lasius niger TaxID=67767 RepID=A0A0J7K575_LASNI|nr:pol [Lasius niger]
MATISESLRSLTRKSEPFVWGKAQRVAFQTLKEKLIESETLGIYNPDARTRVVADASPVGIGCVLAQEQKQQWRVISYASWSLTDYERKYSQTEKEALALVYACERFKYWLFGY